MAIADDVMKAHWQDSSNTRLNIITIILFLIGYGNDALFTDKRSTRNSGNILERKLGFITYMRVLVLSQFFAVIHPLPNRKPFVHDIVFSFFKLETKGSISLLSKINKGHYIFVYI